MTGSDRLKTIRALVLIKMIWFLVLAHTYLGNNDSYDYDYRGGQSPQGSLSHIAVVFWGEQKVRTFYIINSICTSLVVVPLPPAVL